jgi:hypothetical protein
LIYNHYVNIEGIDAPYVSKIAPIVRPEGGGGNYGPNSGGFDSLGFATLTALEDPVSSGAPPSGLTATVSGLNVTLSWWGTLGATQYLVRRANAVDGPYSTIGTVTDNTFQDTSATDGGKYFYKIVAVTPTGDKVTNVAAEARLFPTLLADLKFDSSNGTTAPDSSGNGYNATLVGGPTCTAKDGLSLSGNGQYAALPTGVLSGVTDFTITAWVNVTASNGFARIFDFGNGQISYMYLIPNNREGKLQFAITAASAQGENQIVAPSGLPLGTWSHVAVTERAGVGTFYVNGTPVATKTGLLFTPTDLGTTTQNYIGKSQYQDPTLDGHIADFRVYSGALPADQIAALAAKRPG